MTRGKTLDLRGHDTLAVVGETHKTVSTLRRRSCAHGLEVYRSGTWTGSEPRDPMELSE